MFEVRMDLNAQKAEALEPVFITLLTDVNYPNSAYLGPKLSLLPLHQGKDSINC